MPYELFDAETAAKALADLDGWELSADGAAIRKSFKFPSFARAFGFMTECAMAAERLDHHPDWSNSYSRVDVKLTTHAKKQLTDRDFKLAAIMDEAWLRHL
ncbi:4a-hydroxytetrahydrobiopterin dehydratase [Neorhizobium sp. NCHU2750]|uniref:4a-hydroxytetrahydrobiopterin dehydratase n=1 Tax=Neorhizobium sp. NCHU2750 TaxID=1825976 RepID=UPI000E7291AE|nr:4a-hydroxytetrahydrobiopterin dehydratase [Neorhizobium sp. NCHU2750]